MHNGGDKRIFSYVIFIANTFLYSYSRFVYESIVGFIFGKNVFFVNVLFYSPLNLSQCLFVGVLQFLSRRLGFFIYTFITRKIKPLTSKNQFALGGRANL
jgi:hypothetical protein